MHPSRLSLVLTATAATLATGAATAHGATVSQVSRTVEPEGAAIVFKAGRGEANRVSMTVKGRSVIVRDSGAVLRAKGRCKALDAHRARCGNEYFSARVSLGDRADRLTLAGVPADADGGAGDDRMTGGSRTVRFTGGAGADRLTGGGEGDSFEAGPGRDVVRGRGGGDVVFDTDDTADRYDGGANDSAAKDADTIDFTKRDEAVTVNLAAGTTSTKDRIAGFEGATGGAGDDTLTGDDGANLLAGGSGDDRIDAGAGDDDLAGGPGDDRLDGGDGNDALADDTGADTQKGGAGDDTLDARDDDADSIDCEDGADVVTTDPADTITTACEQANGPGGPVAVVPALDGDSADYALQCTSAGADCEGTLTLTRPDQSPFAAATYSIAKFTEGVVSVPLDAAARAQLAQGVDLVVTLGLVYDKPVGYRVRLQG